jgi:selenocysteine-specific elongation factor
LAKGTPSELLLQTLQRLEPITENELVKRSGLETAVAASALQELEDKNSIVRLNQQLLSKVSWQMGISREELRSRLRLSPAVFNPLLAQAANDGQIIEADALVKVPSHEITFTEDQKRVSEALLRQFANDGVNSPSVKETRAALGDDVYFALVALGRLRPISNDVVYAEPEYEAITDRITSYIRERGRINAAQARDLLGTSRKYAISLLEHLDEIRITRRVGDDRELI